MKGYLFPEYDTPLVGGEHVCVFGGGNVAMDSLRTAMRMGCDDVKCVYRRSEEESCPPGARKSTTPRTKASSSSCCTAPIRFIGDEDNRIKGGGVAGDEAGRAR